MTTKITVIPEGQRCQSFDAKMILAPSILRAHRATENGNVSCLAPAFVYIEGSHGNKFLCDYHYKYELYLTEQGYSHPDSPIEDVDRYVVDERERVKDTFAKNVTTTETLGHKCSIVNSFNKSHGCERDAFIKIKPLKIAPGKVNFTSIEDPANFSESIFYCNFHFRKIYYRYVNNGLIYEDLHEILADERSRMTLSIAEEALNASCI